VLHQGPPAIPRQSTIPLTQRTYAQFAMNRFAYSLSTTPRFISIEAVRDSKIRDSQKDLALIQYASASAPPVSSGRPLSMSISSTLSGIIPQSGHLIPPLSTTRRKRAQASNIRSIGIAW
jgi:hypothetical protein